MVTDLHNDNLGACYMAVHSVIVGCWDSVPLKVQKSLALQGIRKKQLVAPNEASVDLQMKAIEGYLPGGVALFAIVSFVQLTLPLFQKIVRPSGMVGVPLSSWCGQSVRCQCVYFFRRL